MIQANIGNTVFVHYTGTLDDGTEFDSSQGREPLRVTLGNGEVIPGFERAIIGMSQGATKRVTIPVNDAYGEHNPQLVAKVLREDFPVDLHIVKGQMYELQQSEDQTVLVRIAEVTEHEVTLDANHPLAGNNLTFDLTLVEIEN
jgi:peptidylprolyl isomerase